MNNLFGEVDVEPKRKFTGSEMNVRTEGKEEWLTPKYIIDALGPFDLDPCSPINRPWPTAKQHFTIEDNGLLKPWGGARIFLNPPYGRETCKWIARLAEHRNGTALVFARTDTDTWQKHIFGKATSMFFIDGRLKFYHVTGVEAEDNCGAPAVLVAYDWFNTMKIEEASKAGKIKGYHVIKP
jgi:hypothetical protein